MKPRKTINVSKVIENANHTLRTSVNILKPERAFLIEFVEKLLIDSGQYNGYDFLTKDEVEETFTYGIDRTRGDFADQWFKDTDHTRIKFTSPAS